MPLVFVPTPLGNLRDITLRAIDILREAELIVAEDTRVARKLLSALHIDARELWSYREQNARNVTPGILARARDSLVAVVTDAGMPGISDPGSALVAAARAANVPVDVLPGPSAVLGVALLSGFALQRFTFEGFPPRALHARCDAFSRALRSGITSVWYEAPQRIRATLANIETLAADAQIFLVREYTKRYEQQVLGSPREVLNALAEPIRGEIAFAIAAHLGAGGEAIDPGLTQARIDELLGAGRSVADIARTLAESGFGERRTLYVQTSERKRARGKGGASGAERELS